MRPLAWLLAVLLHGAALLLIYTIAPKAPPPPAPGITVMLEVLPTPAQVTKETPQVAGPEPASAFPLSQAGPVPEASPEPPITPTAQDTAATVERPPEPEPSSQPPASTSSENSPAETTLPTPPDAEQIFRATPALPPSAPVQEPLRPVPQRRPSPSPSTAQPRLAPRARTPAEAGAPQAASGSASPLSASPASAPALPLSASWEGQLSAWLQAHKRYPEAARNRGEEGTASLHFTVARDGRVLSVALLRGSGSVSLDEAAVSLLRDAHLPQFPPAMPQNEVSVTVAIRYNLQRH